MCGISLGHPETCAQGKNGNGKSEPFCDEPAGHTGPHGCYALDAAWWDAQLVCGCGSQVREMGSAGTWFCPKCRLPIGKEALV